jgi:FAD synthase
MRSGAIMKVRRRISTVDRRMPALAMIGTWDPMITAHTEIFQKLVERGKEVDLTPVLIMIHPSPAQLVNLEYKRLEYSDIGSRVIMASEAAPVKILVIRFLTRDLDVTFRDFLDLIGSQIDLRELWLGDGQSLGRGPQGSDAGIMKLAEERQVQIRRLQSFSRINEGSAARTLLNRGNLRDAVKLVGHPPTWKKPHRDMLRLHWPPGAYTAMGILRPSLTPEETRSFRIELVLNKNGPQCQFRWPDGGERWLAFVSGPADA